ncbi:hypothetical protein ACVWYH_009415 [Bradyrhizobium sp. GM24.11]|jgi:hypothetical protein
MPKASRDSAGLICLETPAAVRPTPDELAEFERLDATAPLNEDGHPARSFEGQPLTPRERRWLELYRKLADRKDVAKTHERRR